jgi:cytochrome P450
MAFSVFRERAMQPANAIAAASHADPYPYYRTLLDGPPLAYDPALRLWICARAAVIGDVFAHPDCAVRPPAEAVPAAIAGTSAGAVFGQLARMTEGHAHASARQGVASILAALDHGAVRRRVRELAPMAGSPADLTAWMYALPTWLVADIVGIATAQLPQVARLVSDFVACLSPLSSPARLASASDAAQALLREVEALSPVQDDQSRVRSANLVGMLSQTHEATAGLIGNCIVFLLSNPAMLARLRAAPQLADDFVREVARYDPSVQNTRRFVVRATTVAGVALQPGDAILLVLGAAARDPATAADAGVFLLERTQREQHGFGHGRHACPGQELALTIASGAVQHLLAQPHVLDPLALSWSYAPSANARLPQFSTHALKGQP